MKEEVLGTAEIQRYLKYLKLDLCRLYGNGLQKIARKPKSELYVISVVVHAGELKCFKTRMMLEVAKGYDCGIQIKGYNDIEERGCCTKWQLRKKLK
jgi:translation initiation factor IF-2